MNKKRNVIELQNNKDKLMFEYWKLQESVRDAEHDKIKAFQKYHSLNSKWKGLLSKSSIMKDKILDIMREIEGK